MKKFLLLAAIAVFGFSNAQEGFKLGAHIGAPTTGNSPFTLGLDAAYRWNIAKGFDLGVATGYSHFIGKSYNYPGGSIKGDDFGFIPVAVSGKYSFSGAPIAVGLDLGYGISTNSNVNGGLYALPKFMYNMPTGELYLGYQSISGKYDRGYYDDRPVVGKESVGAVIVGYNFYLK
ncbi:MAG: hypothetical protein BGO86_10020 [Chryseobacterium sp. 36-9]|nr:MAG: hypothetical protein BGO86_10020 [Chryseobacterium sp. 36-9]